MADREKVLKGIEACADRTGALCRTCPYDFRKEGCISDMARDALELLKEQEPVKPIRLENWWKCPSCSGNIVYNMKYCPGCGRRVKWDG